MPKVMVIGFDAPITKSVKRYMEEGDLPNLKGLVERGVWMENCLVPHPTITPPNWTTLATGAYPGTHGITCFHLPKDGIPGPAEECVQAFRSLDVKAEYIWEAGERAGKRAIVLNYPSTWPPRMKESIQIGGYGLNVSNWRMTRDLQPLPGWKNYQNLADHQCVTTYDLPLADRVELGFCKGWSAYPDGSRLEVEVEVGKYNSLDSAEPRKIFLLIEPENGEVLAFEDKSSPQPIFKVKRGEWSKRSKLRFKTKRGEVDAWFKAKLEELSSDGKHFKLYFTTFCSLSGGTYPEEIAKEIEEKVTKGLPVRTDGDGVALGWISNETYGDILALDCTWLGEVANYLLSSKEWDIFYMQAHAPDHFYHLLINPLDHHPDEVVRESILALERRLYISLDQMVGRILETADEETIVAIVSDHGASPTDPAYKQLSVGRILAEAGLLKFKEEGGIDWQNTLAFPDRSSYIRVNLKSKYPFGCVGDEDYEKIREEILKALLSYRDPGTGRCPFAFVLRREEAIMLGLRGEGVGDVIFGCHAETPHEHGWHITSGEYSLGSLKGLFILSGWGVKKGVVLERQVNIADLVPTLCYLTGIPVPKTCEGAVIYQALEDEDGPWSELGRLRGKYAKLEETLRITRSLTHSYE